MGVVTDPTLFDGRRLESVFHRCFAASENTRLVGGAAEPLYQPASEHSGVHSLYYREDYFASALHEISHWCIAGQARRQQIDFGYWYAPEGRNQKQQRAFETAEVKPQALEWFFSLACDYPFQISVDNFSSDGTIPDTQWFRQQLLDQARRWQADRLPPRGHIFFVALGDEFGTRVDPVDLSFEAEALV